MKQDPTPKPENHVDPPDIAKMFGIPVKNSPFLDEMEQAFAWMNYVWKGPAPRVQIDLSEIYQNHRFSSQAIYQSIVDAIERLRIPGVRYGPELLREAGPFSEYRIYLKIKRELSQFLVCASPAGNSYFITVRKIDQFVHVKWFHYLFAGIAIFIFSFLGVFQFGLVGGFVAGMVSLCLVWSIMRYAAYSAAGWLAEHLHEVPVLGAIYLRWFRPDTYFRQDFHNAFLALVSGAIKEVVAGLSQVQGVRPPTEQHGAPILGDMQKL